MHLTRALLLLTLAWTAVTPETLPPCSERVLLWWFEAPVMGWRYCNDDGSWVWLEPTGDRYIYEPQGIKWWMPLPAEAKEPPAGYWEVEP